MYYNGTVGIFHPHTSRSNVARTLILLTGAFFLACALLYNPWTISLAVDGIRKALNRPWTRVPDTASVLRMELVYFALGAVALGAGLLIGARPRLDRFFRRPAAATLVLACLAFAVPAATLEVALRPYTPTTGKTTSLFVKDRALGWRLRPSATQPWGGVTVTVNARGLRGPELAYEKTPGTFRVLYLGDSVTFGYMVERWQDTFPFVTDSLLSATAGSRVETINTAVDGYSPWQEFEVLRGEGIRYDPDVVVVNFVLNDVTEKFTLVRYGGLEESRQLRESYYSRLDAILSGSALAYQVKNFAREWKAKRVLGSDPQLGAIRRQAFDVDALMRNPDADYIQGAWSITLGNMQKIFDFCGERGIPVLLAVYPFRVQLDSPDELSAPQRRLCAYARERGIRTVDFLPVLRAHLDATGRSPDSLFLDDDHLSVAGHRVIASALADSLAVVVGGRRGE